MRKLSNDPIMHIRMMAYEGQLPQMRQYRPGYEHYLKELPELSLTDPKPDMDKSTDVLNQLGERLRHESWITKDMPETFDRSIIAMEQPEISCLGYPGSQSITKEGAELIVARWGTGFTSPVHGHADGLLYENVITGKFRVNTYQHLASGITVPLRTEIVKEGVFLNKFNRPNVYHTSKRQHVIHNFTALEPSVSLHYVSEHTRDGRDNTFKVTHFNDQFPITVNDVERLTAFEGMYARKGDVILVRSSNVPEYGDHYIVVTGHPVLKEHGLRPQDIAIQAPGVDVLDHYEPVNGLILLRLKDDLKALFNSFHGITMQDNNVIFPA